MDPGPVDGLARRGNALPRLRRQGSLGESTLSIGARHAHHVLNAESGPVELDRYRVPPTALPPFIAVCGIPSAAM
jgi:hypothetical protein